MSIELKLHQITTPIYWNLRESGFSNIEAEDQVARYKRWLRRAEGTEQEQLFG
jgi:hypothetical protein